MRYLALIAMFLLAGSVSAEQCTTLHKGKTLSQWASKGRVGPVKDLIRNHCDVNSTSPTDTALQAAIKSSEPGAQAVVYWVANRKGVNLERRDSSDLTPLMLAAKHDNVSAAAILVASGAKINGKNDDKRTALHYARTPEMFIVLIDLGADVNATSIRGFTPLHIVAEHLNEGYIVDRLIAKGAKTTINKAASMLEGDLTPLMVAAIQDKPSAILPRLIAYGAEFEVEPPDILSWTWSAMHYAARYGHVDNVRQLIKAGADVNWGIDLPNRVFPMTSAFFGARWINRTEVIREMIKAGGRMVADDGRWRAVVTDGHIDAHTLRAMLENPNAYWPIRAHAMGISFEAQAPATAWLEVNCHEDSGNCLVYLDCTDDDAAKTGNITVSAGAMNRYSNLASGTNSIGAELGLGTDESWTGRLDCALRSQQRITAQVWTATDSMFANTTRYIRSDENNRAILQRLSHFWGRMYLRIRCIGEGDCTNTFLQCSTYTGGAVSDKPDKTVSVGTIDRFETITLYNNNNARDGDKNDLPQRTTKCTAESEDAFLVQMLVDHDGDLLNNTGVSME